MVAWPDYSSETPPGAPPKQPGLRLLASEECQVTEAGSSNFFVLIKNATTGRAELVTPPLDDKVILEGITRQSVLDLARSRLSDQLDVLETNIAMYELKEAWKEGRILEAFVSGTAVSGT